MRYFLVLCCLSLLVGACKKDKKGEGQEPGPSGTPLVTEVPATTGPAIQQNVGEAGGTITSADGSISLVIPAGALTSSQTISIQPIENKLPSGVSKGAYRFLPEGLHFAVPVTVKLTYTDAEIADLNSVPDFLCLATRQADGKWKKVAGAVTVNKNARTATATIEHFSDYSWFEQYALKVGNSLNEGIYEIDPGQKVEISAVTFVELEGVAILPVALNIANAYNWKINGESTNISQYGSLAAVSGSLAIKRFEAPTHIAPNSNSNMVAISVEVKNPNGGPGQFVLVANLRVMFEGAFKINGTPYYATALGVTVGNGSMVMSWATAQGPSISVTIQGFTGPGTYQFATPPPNKPGYLGYVTEINASTGLQGSTWLNKKPDPNSPGAYIYSSGTLTVYEGVTHGDVFRATLSGNTFKYMTNEGGTVNGSFTAVAF